jgi:hypothetical protein
VPAGIAPDSDASTMCVPRQAAHPRIKVRAYRLSPNFFESLGKTPAGRRGTVRAAARATPAIASVGHQGAGVANGIRTG